jgi:hypothetical protein
MYLNSLQNKKIYLNFFYNRSDAHSSGNSEKRGKKDFLTVFKAFLDLLFSPSVDSSFPERNQNPNSFGALNSNDLRKKKKSKQAKKNLF